MLVAGRWSLNAMDVTFPWWLIPGFLLVAALYSSVGHGGASGYLALLSLATPGVAPETVATTALTLNLLVAGIALRSFLKRGHFSGGLTWPFALASVPAAFVGGLTSVSSRLYAALLAIALAVAAWRLLTEVGPRSPSRPRTPAFAVALPVGGGIGWLSGVVGVGGGIFLSPLLLLSGWATPQQTAAASACFIVVNSAAGLAGRFVRGALDLGTIWPLGLAALAGGLIGSRLGADRMASRTLRRLLALVLMVAVVKLLRATGGQG